MPEKKANPQKSVAQTASKEAAEPVVSKEKETGEQEFAVIETGGKQYRVSVGDTINIEKLKEEYNAGDKVVFDSVLLVDNGRDTTIGTPYIDQAKVEGVVEDKGRQKKVNVIQYKAKSRQFTQKGHRQPYLKVRISSIQ